MKILIRGGHVIDPANHVDGKLNLLTEDGKILWAGTGLPEADKYIDATGKIVTPGFIDIHIHGREGFVGLGDDRCKKMWDVLVLGHFNLLWIDNNEFHVRWSVAV